MCDAAQQAKFPSVPWGRGVRNSDVADYLRAGWGCWQCRSALEHTWAQSARCWSSLPWTALQVEGALAGTLARWLILMHAGRWKLKRSDQARSILVQTNASNLCIILIKSTFVKWPTAYKKNESWMKRKVHYTLYPIITGNNVCRRLNSAMETVTEACNSVRHVSLVGMNSSKLVISSGVAGAWFSSGISSDTTERIMLALEQMLRQTADFLICTHCQPVS